MSKDDWWFGRTDFGAVVFDESIQLNDESVLLYVLEQNDVKKYIASEIRPMLRKETNSEHMDKLSKKYRSWKQFYSSRLKNLVKEKPFSYQEAKDNAEAEHRKKLEKLGLPYKGINVNSTKSHRSTNCYDCKANIDNAINLECKACGWILCECGACGCGYSQST